VLRHTCDRIGSGFASPRVGGCDGRATIKKQRRVCSQSHGKESWRGHFTSHLPLCLNAPGTPNVDGCSPTATTRVSYSTSNSGRRPSLNATALVQRATFGADGGHQEAAGGCGGAQPVDEGSRGESLDDCMRSAKQ
jgi:hypothetical protein